MALILGRDHKLYWDEESAYASPVWNLIDIASDVTLNLEGTESAINIRATDWELTALTQKVASVEFSIINDPANAAFVALNDAFQARSGINIAVMNGLIATTGSQGLRAIMVVTAFTRNEPVTEHSTIDVTLKPAYHSTNRPNWLTVS